MNGRYAEKSEQMCTLLAATDHAGKAKTCAQRDALSACTHTPMAKAATRLRSVSTVTLVEGLYAEPT